MECWDVVMGERGIEVFPKQLQRVLPLSAGKFSARENMYTMARRKTHKSFSRKHWHLLVVVVVVLLLSLHLIKCSDLYPVPAGASAVPLRQCFSDNTDDDTSSQRKNIQQYYCCTVLGTGNEEKRKKKKYRQEKRTQE